MTDASYNVQIDREAIQEALSLFEFLGGNSADALRVAINKAGPKVRTLASRAIRAQVSLKATYVNEKLQFRKASRANLEGRLTTPSRGTLITRYSTDPKVGNFETGMWESPPPNPYGGHYVKIKAGYGEKKLGRGDESKPFYMVLKNSQALGIVRRTADGKINALYGPSLSQVFNSVRDAVLPDAGAELQRQMLDAMRYLLIKQHPSET